MTGPEDSQTPSRPISVAELLAKNGTIGAPPVGGRRRRRRGNADAVTVAELTGEIPIISDDSAQTSRGSREHDTSLDETTVAGAAQDPVRDTAEPTRNGRNGTQTLQADRPGRASDKAEPRDRDSADLVTDSASSVVAPDTTGADIEADYGAHLKTREIDPEPVEFRPRPRRQFASGTRDFTAGGTGAEQMSPDPLDDLDDGRDGADTGFDDHLDTALDVDDTDPDERERADTSYPLGPLFGGPSVDRDLERDLDRDLDDTDVEYDDELDEEELDDDEGSPLVRGMWVVAQCIIAVAFGAGLFVAFDQLWKWNTIVALVLGVLVILGLAGGVRVVRKTEDIGSTLTAVAVGALVTFGPLALLQAS
ncbi:FUSC family protein [Mycolicibacterium goodii]|uniref:FUSC family protein n=1 Tax=Mycolicibacterium goodii TaxID=134601 RepID=UPI001BDBEAC3|nr:FUSC family protein [Mycolicibacterium goodii]MBU8833023.1 FUSC family protein [Mycolicibacterium goodii]